VVALMRPAAGRRHGDDTLDRKKRL